MGIKKKMKAFLLSTLLIAYTIAGSCDISKNGRCGPSHGNTYCTPKAFCSRFGWCGIGAAWSAHSANSKYDGSAACVKAQQKPPTKIVTLTNQKSHKNMGVKGAHFNEHNKLIQWRNNNQENQRFQMVFLNAHEFQLIPMKGQELSVQMTQRDGLTLQKRDDSPDGIWHQDGDYIKNKEGKCLSVRGASTRNGATVSTWKCVNHADQKWSVHEHSSRRRLSN